MAKTEAQKRASKKYNTENTMNFGITLNKRTDADIIEMLEQVGNKQGYIKSLIRADIAARQER